MEPSKNSTKRNIAKAKNTLLSRRSVLMAVIDGAGGAALIARVIVKGD